MKRILIVGATSGIATACARLWAEQGSEFFLVARSAEKLAQVSADLSARGAKTVTVRVEDTLDPDGDGFGRVTTGTTSIVVP